MTTSGSTTSCSSKRATAPGSESSTEVSSTKVVMGPRLAVGTGTGPAARPDLGPLTPSAHRASRASRREPAAAATVRRTRARGWETRGSPEPDHPAGSDSEPPLPRGVRPQRAQEVDVPEVRPVGLAEVELAVGALPEQEAAEPLLATGADHQVRIGLATGVEVLRDVLDVEELGDLGQGGALRGVRLQHRADGVGDLLPAAVPDGDVDLDTGPAGGSRG